MPKSVLNVIIPELLKSLLSFSFMLTIQCSWGIAIIKLLWLLRICLMNVLNCLLYNIASTIICSTFHLYKLAIICKWVLIYTQCMDKKYLKFLMYHTKRRNDNTVYYYYVK